ncbi:monocarboxylate transporter 5 isoform X1 [Argonauta hians]
MEGEQIVLRKPKGKLRYQNRHSIVTYHNDNKKAVLTINQRSELFFVLLSGFVTNFMVFGFSASLSVYFVKYKRAFPDHYEIVLLTIYLETGIFSLIGIPAGGFSQKFGVRATAVLGTIMFTLGIGSSSFAPNVIFLMCFFGILSGIGCSFLFYSMNVGVASYLGDSGRHFMPFLSMGGSAGGMICPPLVSYLIDIYGWRGSLLILAAIILNSLPCGLVYSTMNKYGHYSMMKKNDDTKARQDSHGETDVNCIYSLLNTDIEQRDDDWNDEVTDELFSIESLNMLNTADANNFKRSETSLQPKPSVMSAADDKCSLGSQNSKITEKKENFEKEIDEKSPKDLFLSIFSNKMFVLFMITLTVVVSSEFTLAAMTSDFFVSKGTTRSVAAQIYGIIFAGEILAHITCVWLLHNNKVNSLVIFCISSIFNAAFVMIYPSIPTMSSLQSAGWAMLLGIFEMTTHGCYQAVFTNVLLDLFDKNRYPFALGLCMTLSGIFVPIYGYVIGIITRHYHNDYTISFYILATLEAVFTLPTLLYYIVTKRKRQNKLPK